MSFLSFSPWKCPKCQLERLPEEEIVKQDDKFYQLRVCRVCKYQDIELLSSDPAKHTKKSRRFRFGGEEYDLED